MQDPKKWLEGKSHLWQDFENVYWTRSVAPGCDTSAMLGPPEETADIKKIFGYLPGSDW